MDDLSKQESTFKKILEVAYKEKNAIATFESRIGKTREIKKNFRKIYHNINKTDEYEKILEYISNLKKIFKELNYAFSVSLNEQELDQSLDIIDSEIMDSYEHFNQAFKAQESIGSERISNRIENLRKMVGAEKELSNIIQKFEENIRDFRGIIESQKENVKKVFNLLTNLEQDLKNCVSEGKFKSITDEKINEYRHFLKIYRRDFERLIAVEKELVHEPLINFLKSTKRSKKLVESLKKKSQITKEDIMKDFETFSRHDEYTAYIASVRRSGLLNGSEEKEIIEDLFDRKLEVAGEVGFDQHYRSKWLNYLAFTDHLTELNNRRSLERGFKRFMKKNQNVQNLTYSTLFFDIDDFKAFNSLYGHEYGDKVLSSVSSITVKTVKKMIPKHFPEDPIISRWGGEEFVIFLPFFNKEDALKVAEEVRNEIQFQSYNEIMPEINRKNEGLINSSESNIRRMDEITVSIGLSNYPEDTDNQLLYRILRIANLRMKQAKEKGKNCTVSS